jgi:hypothetical protein
MHTHTCHTSYLYAGAHIICLYYCQPCDTYSHIIPHVQCVAADADVAAAHKHVDMHTRRHVHLQMYQNVSVSMHVSSRGGALVQVWWTYSGCLV